MYILHNDEPGVAICSLNKSMSGTKIIKLSNIDRIAPIINDFISVITFLLSLYRWRIYTPIKNRIVITADKI